MIRPVESIFVDPLLLIGVGGGMFVV